jgi:hypothetical protein
MTERLSNELASLLAEDDGRSERSEGRGLLRARLARDMSEGLEQDARAQGEREEDVIDRARIAAYLDCSLPPAERDPVAVKLASDPVVRSEMSSALLLLRGLDERTVALPAGLLARAAGILAAAQPVRPQTSAAWRKPVAVWSQRPAAWSALAAVLLVAVLTPAVVSIVQERNAAPNVQDVNGAPVRGVTPVPAGKDKEQDTRKCETAQEGAAQTPEPSAKPPSADDDPCRPKPAVKDDRKRP